MTSQTKSPGALAARAPNFSLCLAAGDGSDDKPDSLKIQHLRAAWLARRAAGPLGALLDLLAEGSP